MYAGTLLEHLVGVYRCLLTNCLQLQGNNYKIYTSTLIASTACVHGMRMSFYHVVMVKFIVTS